MDLEHLYQRLPLPLQNAACSYYGLKERAVRLGADFNERYRSLLASEAASRSEIDAYQDEQVAFLAAHAYETVPYYRRVFDERGLRPSDVVSVSDLGKLPVLRKEDVVQHREELISRAYSRANLRVGKTSGTTGTALSFVTTQEAIAFQWAVWWRHRARFGVQPLTWHLNFTGKPVVPIEQSRPPYWRWNWPMRQGLVSMQHLTSEKVSHIASFAGSHDFRYYSGYPSVIHRFVELASELEIEMMHKPTHVFLGAENVQDYQRTAIEKLSGARVTDQYGFSEGCGNASRCEHDLYHEDWEFGVLECFDGSEAAGGGRRGRILATGFANHAFPFLRYEVGDTAVWAEPEARCKCGRASTVLTSVDGRNEDYVVTPEGTRVMRFDYLFKNARGVRQAQVVQRDLGSIIVRYVPRSSLSRSDFDDIREHVRTYISPTLQVEFEELKEIPVGVSGKFRPVVSELRSDVE